MAKKYVEFKVAATDGAAYWLKVEKQPIVVVNGVGGLDLDEGEHTLYWWLVGNPGNTLSVVGKQDAKVVVEVKDRKIPQGQNEAEGYKPFTV
jgi:hypothetical protein